MVVVDVARVCNASCIHCAYRVVKDDPLFQEGPKFMSWNVFKVIADECSQYPDLNFRFTCHGEPLLHPKIIAMVKYAKKLGISPVSINTNGSLLTEDMAEALIRTGIDVIEVSLDAFSKEKYEAVRRNLNFENTMENLKNLIRLKENLKTDTRILVSIIDQPETNAELEDFQSYWEGKVDRVIKRIYFSHDGLTPSDKITFDIPDSRHPCPFLWKRIVVTSDGRVKFCLEDWLDRKVTPFPALSSIHKIWKSQWYDSIRKLHLENKFPEIPFCSDCKDWWAHFWEKDYFYALGMTGD